MDSIESGLSERENFEKLASRAEDLKEKMLRVTKEEDLVELRETNREMEEAQGVMNARLNAALEETSRYYGVAPRIGPADVIHSGNGRFSGTNPGWNPQFLDLTHSDSEQQSYFDLNSDPEKSRILVRMSKGSIESYQNLSSRNDDDGATFSDGSVHIMLKAFETAARLGRDKRDSNPARLLAAAVYHEGLHVRRRISQEVPYKQPEEVDVYAATADIMATLGCTTAEINNHRNAPRDKKYLDDIAQGRLNSLYLTDQGENWLQGEFLKAKRASEGTRDALNARLKQADRLRALLGRPRPAPISVGPAPAPIRIDDDLGAPVPDCYFLCQMLTLVAQEACRNPDFITQQQLDVLQGAMPDNLPYRKGSSPNLNGCESALLDGLMDEEARAAAGSVFQAPWVNERARELKNEQEGRTHPVQPSQPPTPPPPNPPPPPPTQPYNPPDDSRPSRGAPRHRKDCDVSPGWAQCP